LQKVFSDEQGIKTIEKQISTIWGYLFHDGYCKDVRLSTKTGSIQELLSRVEVSLLYSEQGNEQSIDSISDGMKSLFYLTLISSVFETEQKVFSGKIPGLRFDKEQLPIYTIFGIEEPENHLAPHYLSRIMGVLQNLGSYSCSQVVLTSHSPSIMKRISPDQVRHFRIDLERNIFVSKIALPPDKEEASKYVKQAIIAYPELYFSRLVILGEGDSEEIILPRMGKTLGIDFEEQFISVVPLGGRHVNHFWKLLNQLNIPHITLLDLDNLRGGGDWGRIAYVIEQLQNHSRSFKFPFVKKETKAPYSLDEIKQFSVDIEREYKWINKLSESDNVFFSTPIDIDWLMYQSYRDEYQSIYLDYQNSIPKKNVMDWKKKTSAAIAAVYKTNDGTPTPDTVADWEDYFWYRYIFLGRGKPSSHALMLSQISDEKLRDNCPDVYRSLIAKTKTLLGIE
jgi:predicted ATP-dependent endonuclease of OLD family